MAHPGGSEERHRTLMRAEKAKRGFGVIMRICLTSQVPSSTLRAAAFSGGVHHRWLVTLEAQAPELGVTRSSLSSGPGHPHYTVRGCATASWCHGLHVAEAFRLTDPNVSCCTGNGCNHPNPDAQSRRGGAPRPSPAHLSLTITLLMTARFWGGTLLWT